MIRIDTLFFVSYLFAAPSLFAQNARPTSENWTKAAKTPKQRGTLHDRFEKVRGDSGKWNDNPQLLHAVLPLKSDKASLDARFERLLDKNPKPGPGGEHWLLFRTRQLNDNDRVWVQQIERQGNRFTLVIDEAVWQGKYRKNFTYYDVGGVNLGALKPGEYTGTLTIRPLVFRQFVDVEPRTRTWPKDDRATGKEPKKLQVTFRVIE